MLSILFLPLIFISLFNLVNGLKKQKHALGLHCLNITYLYIYGLGGFYSVFNYPENLWLYKNFYREDFYFILTALLISLAYVFSYKSYLFFSKINLTKNKLIDIGLLKKASNISLVLCIVFIYVYSSQYGGLYNALESAAAIRSGYGELEDGAKLTFVKYLNQQL